MGGTVRVRLMRIIMAIRIAIVIVIAIVVLYIVRIAIRSLVIWRIMIIVDGELVGLAFLIGGLRL
jgi:hypothetical protein